MAARDNKNLSYRTNWRIKLTPSRKLRANQARINRGAVVRKSKGK